MPFTIFNHLPQDQLRRDPPSEHVSDPLDGFAATVLSGTPPAVNAPGTYPLQDGEELEVIISGVPTVVAFDAADFGDISEATSAEVAAVLDLVSGITATPEGAFVRVTTDAIGAGASLEFSGDANEALLFPVGPTFGETGRATLVLGHDRPGRIERVTTGDEITVSNQLTVFDESRVQLVGVARVPALPVGASWELTLLVDGAPAYSRTFTTGTHALNEFGFSTAQQPGAVTLGLRLRALGFPLGGADTELPAFYVDVVRSIVASDVQLLNRFPSPDTAGHSADPSLTLEVDIASTVNGTAVDQAATEVYIDGVLAYDGSTDTFQPGWDGGGSSSTFGVIYNAGATDLRLIFESNGLTFTSEQVIEVEVVSQHVGGAGAIDTFYEFTTADTQPLTVVSAQARDKLTVRVTFDDAFDPVAAVDPANYVFTNLTVPAVTLTAVEVTIVDAVSVDVTVDLEMSQGADYVVTVVGLEDDEGNSMDSSANFAQFAGFTPNVPAGRRFQVVDWFSDDNLRRDVGDLRTWCLVMQDTVDLLLCLIDEWVTVFDVDVAPEEFVDAILADLGNPFDFIELSADDKRRLARTLVDIYKSKGTEQGLIDVVRFLTGVEVSLDVVNARDDFWQLGVSKLGVTTLLAPPSGSPLWYSFWIDAVSQPTAAQQDAILKIATYMKAAHEHILGLRDPDDVAAAAAVYWLLGYNALGKDTVAAT